MSLPPTSMQLSAPTIAVYCPACGEDGGEVPIEVLSPGNIDWACRACETVFRIEIGFVPLRAVDDD